MKRLTSQRSLLGLASLATLLLVYTLLSNAYRAALPNALAGVLRPDIIPPTQEIAQAFGALVASGSTHSAGEDRAHHAGHVHMSDHVMTLLQEKVTLQQSLAISLGRVLFGLAVGAPLGILLGLLMGWSRKADDYVHPIYVLIRSVPPLAFITYIMLWLGHGEAHRLIPIVYAVATTLVIPTYHGIRDVAGTYLIAAQSLGARGRLLLMKVLLPAASPAVLAGFRYAIAIAWMTAIGAEMLMSENGMGNLLVGGGIWSSRLQTRTDPAVVMVGILAVAVAGWAMDAVARSITGRLTRWAR